MESKSKVSKASSLQWGLATVPAERRPRIPSVRGPGRSLGRSAGLDRSEICPAAGCACDPRIRYRIPNCPQAVGTETWMWPAGRTNFSIPQATPQYMTVLRRVTHTLLRWYSSAKLGIANKRSLAG